MFSFKRFLNTKVLLSLLTVFIGFSEVSASDENATDKQILMFGFSFVEEPLWVSTFNPRQRDQLYMPAMTTDFMDYKDVNVNLFFNRTASLSQGLKEMFTLQPLNDLVTQGLKQQGLSKTEAENTRENIFALANKMTFQEHRLGLSLEKEFRFNNWTFSALGWLGLAERNFWLGEKEREELAKEFDKFMPETDSAFDYKEFMKIDWGIGDIRLRGGYLFKPDQRTDVNAGLQVILPTGTRPSRKTKNRSIPLDSKYEFGKNYLFERVKEVLIEPSMGNGGHLGLGLYSKADWQIPNTKATAHVGLSIDRLMSAFESRMFLNKKTVDPDDLSPGSMTKPLSDPTKFNGMSTDTELLSVIKYLILPEPASVRIKPGNVVHLDLSVSGPVSKHWTGQVGYDFYHKSKEQMEHFKYPTDVNVYRLDTDEVVSKRKTQHKMFASFAYNRDLGKVSFLWYSFDHLALSCRLGGDVSFGSEGMGDDFSLNAAFGFVF